MHNRFYTAALFAAFPFVGVIFSSVFGELFTQGATSGWHRYASPRDMLVFAAYQAPFSAVMGAMLASAFVSASPKDFIFRGARYGFTIAFFSGIAAATAIELHGTGQVAPSLTRAIWNFMVIYVSLGLHLLAGAVTGIVAITHAGRPD